MGIVSRSQISGAYVGYSASIALDGQLIESADPALFQDQGTTLSLTPRCAKVAVPVTVTVSTVTVVTGTTAGAGLIAGSNRVGVYTVSGNTATLASQSADITSWPANNSLTTALQASVTITGGPNVFCYLALMSSTTVTQPTFGRTFPVASSLPNAGLVAASGFRTGELAAVVSGQPLANSFTLSAGISGISSLYYIAAR